MKRLLSILVLSVLALNMAACGNTTPTTETEKTETVKSETTTTETASKEYSEEQNEDEEISPEEKALMGKVQKSIDENSKKVPVEISKLATIDGNLDGNVVIVNTQGGPMYQLDIVTVRMMLEESVGQTDTIIVNVHQQQTLNPNAFSDKEITFEEAKAYDTKSVDDLAKVVNYFKDDGKTVYVFGMSFGSWMVQDLIANYGTDIADNFFISNGRVDMPEEIWKAFSKGGSGYFENGTKTITNLEGTMEDPKAAVGTIPPADKNIAKLAAGLGHKRYSELLSNTDLSKLFYLHGQTDEAVGKLDDAEVNFLKKQGATVVTYDGGHSAPNDKMKEGFNFLGIQVK